MKGKHKKSFVWMCSRVLAARPFISNTVHAGKESIARPPVPFVPSSLEIELELSGPDLSASVFQRHIAITEFDLLAPPIAEDGNTVVFAAGRVEYRYSEQDAGSNTIPLPFSTRGVRRVGPIVDGAEANIRYVRSNDLVEIRVSGAREGVETRLRLVFTQPSEAWSVDLPNLPAEPSDYVPGPPPQPLLTQVLMTASSTNREVDARWPENDGQLSSFAYSVRPVFAALEVADVNRDGVLDFFDVLAFLEAFDSARR